MAVPLNKVPQGLLDFFGIKSGEWGPRELGQVLQPVLELGPWYENGYALEVEAALPAAGAFVASQGATTIAMTNTFPVNLVDGAGNIVVPQNEVWQLLEAGTGWTFPVPAAGQRADVWWSFRGIAMPQYLVGPNTGDATIQLRGHRTLARPFWARPGDTISLIHGGIIVPAGTVTVFNCRLRLNRFQI